jgi:hypothetical protein
VIKSKFKIRMMIYCYKCAIIEWILIYDFITVIIPWISSVTSIIVSSFNLYPLYCLPEDGHVGG